MALRTHPNRTLALLVATVAVGATAVVACWLNNGAIQSPTPGEMGQSARASASGVTLALEHASYSGTDTLVSFRVVNDLAAASAVVIPSEAIRLDGFERAYDDGTLLIAGRGLIRLPPIARNGRASITVTSVLLRTSAGDRVLPGTWVLELRVPGGSELSGALAVETLHGDTAAADGMTIAATAIRSRNSVEVTYQVPEDARMLSLPRLGPEGGPATLAPFRDRNNGDGTHTASFSETYSGQPLRVEFGPLSTSVAASDEARVTLDARALSSLSETTSLVPVPLLGTNAGDPDLVQSAAILALPGQLPRLSLILNGNWPSTGLAADGKLEVSWQVTDSRGVVLDTYDFQENYSKDANGVVGYGTTTVTVTYKDAAALTDVTVRTSRRAEILRGPWVITLK